MVRTLSREQIATLAQYGACLYACHSSVRLASQRAEPGR